MAAQPTATADPAVAEDAAPAPGIGARAQQLAGGRQILAGFVLVVAASAVVGFVPMFKEKGEKHTESFLQILGPRALIFLAVPVAIASIPLLFLNHRRRRVAWNIAAFLIGLWVLLMQQLGIYYVLGAGAIVWGVMKASRAEGPAGMGFGRFSRPARTPVAATDAEPSPEDAEADDVEADGAHGEAVESVGRPSRGRKRLFGS